ncbi:GNAT family N-acetyltransferase [Skermanella stibiiresistens]|uniref:GNAT family N-acetyltransferase n=1 Tax=Skermanella stibiiresistens TaxID=913326 RepID=UPI0012F9633A|nr:GNAT family N-acetyltransferase [Skermanella stibiiresistens]
MEYEFEFSPVGRVPDLAALWRDLEGRAAGSFFLSWLWIGCWLDNLPATTRPHLLIARRRGHVVGLAILCRRVVWRRRVIRTPTWLLHETGDAAIDNLTIEYNGILADRTDADGVAVACLTWLARNPTALGDLAFGGLAPRDETLVRAVAADLGFRCRVVRSDTAHHVDLDKLRGQGGDYRAGLGRSTRAGVNRALRLYQERGGIDFQVAGNVDQALRFFDGLEILHRRTWAARGQSGAFACPVFGSFHRTLIRQGMASGAVRLCRVSAGGEPFGYLYNFVWRGAVLNYQSGFAYEDDNRMKPGLVSHVLAIEDSLARGEAVYDFMAGAAGHKEHLSNASAPMSWLVISPRSLRASALEWLGSFY